MSALSPDHLASQGNLSGDGVRNGDESDSNRASMSSLSDEERAWDKHDQRRPPLPAGTVRTIENQAESTTCDIVIHPGQLVLLQSHVSHGMTLMIRCLMPIRMEIMMVIVWCVWMGK